MAKKPKQPLTAVYVLVHDEKIEGRYDTLDKAIASADESEMDGAEIWVVTDAHYLAYPEDPRIQVYGRPLAEVLDV